MTLAEAQGLFYSLLTRKPVDPAGVDACFRGTQTLSARERVQIYVNMVLWRQIDALRGDFPKLAKVLGDEAFAELVERYLSQHPSEHPSLAWLGRHLPAFLRAGPAARPELADLAELEWARCEVFYEVDQAPLPQDAFSRLDPEEFASRSLKLVPALRRLSLGHNVPALWRRVEDGQEAGAAEASPTRVVVWRQGFDVFHTPLSPGEAEALELSARGAPLGEICAVFAERDDAAQAAFSMLASWLSDGWVAEIA